MMLPALVILGIGRRRRLWIPLPAFLLWPFWVLGWLVWVVFKLMRLRWEKPLWTVLLMGAQLSGFRLDLQTKDARHIHVRMI
jgi:hypothetical protein